MLNPLDNPIEYLNDTVMCKLAPSKIHGVGVFAIKDIPEGAELTDNDRDKRYPPYIYSLSENEFLRLNKEVRDLILDKTLFGTRLATLNFISPNFECFLQDFCNHSDTPNVDCNFCALRDIKEGEEILEDFRFFPFLGAEAHWLVKEHYQPFCKFPKL